MITSLSECVQTLRFVPWPAPPHPVALTPLPYLIKLIQSGACVRAGPHYLRLSGPGRPLTPQSLSPCCANASNRGSRWPHTAPYHPHPGGAEDEQLVGAWRGPPPPPPPSTLTQEAPTHRGVCPLHSFNLEGLNMGSRDLQGSLRGLSGVIDFY